MQSEQANGKRSRNGKAPPGRGVEGMPPKRREESCTLILTPSLCSLILLCHVTLKATNTPHGLKLSRGNGLRSEASEKQWGDAAGHCYQLQRPPASSKLHKTGSQTDTQCWASSKDCTPCLPHRRSPPPKPAFALPPPLLQLIYSNMVPPHESPYNVCHLIGGGGNLRHITPCFSCQPGR